MAKNTQLAVDVVNEQADLLARRLDNGYLRLYSGTQPATADTALSGNTLLAEFRFDDPCAPAAVNGVITFVTPDAVYALASGTATWFRTLEEDGSTAVLDGSASISGDTPNLVLSSATIAAGNLILLGSMSHSVLRGFSSL